MRKLYIGLGIILMLLGEKTLFAQQGEYLFNKQEFDIQDGLSHHVVNDIFQDSRGLIWLATDFGINRYDGHEIKFWTSATSDLEENVIHHIAEDSEGILWLCQWERPMVQFGLKKLFLFHSLTHQAMSLAEKFGDSFPLAEDELQTFFQTEKGEIILIGNKTSWRYHHETGFQPLNIPEQVSFVSYHGEERLFLMQGADLLQVDLAGTVLNRIPLPEDIDIPQEYVKLIYNAIPFGPTGLVIATFPGTFARGKDGDYSPLMLNTFGRERFTIFNDTSLLVTQAGRIKAYDSKLNEITKLQPFLSSAIEGRINDILITPEGAIFLAGQNGFLILSIQKNRFQNLLTKASLKDFPFFKKSLNGIRGITKYKDWVIAKASPYLEQVNLHTGEIKIHKGIEGNPILKSREGEIYTIDKNKNIISYDPVSQQKLEIKGRFNSKKESWSLYEDAYGSIWMSLAGLGILQLESNGQKILKPLVDYNGFEEIKVGQVIAFVEERPDRVWLCSSTGLYLFDPQSGIQARFAASEKGEYYLPATDIHHLHIDSEGIFWLATATSGLIRWDASQTDVAKRFQHFGMVEGFPSNELYAVYEDAYSFLWIPSSYGLIQFDKRALTFKVYHVEDGITHREFNRTSHFQAPDGTLLFGGLDGITAFHPKDFHHTTSYAQPIHITDFKVFNGEQDELIDQHAQVVATHEVSMQHNDRFFTLKVSLQDYLAQSSVKYRYRLANLSKNWQTMEGNSLQLSGLPYGRHQLQIQARGRENRLSNQELSLEIRVIRPIYLRPYFLVIMAMLMILAVWFLVRWRTFRLRQRQNALEKIVEERTRKIADQARSLQELDSLKSRFFANISHELRTPLTLIMGPLQRLGNTMKERSDKHLVQLAQQHTRQLVNLINELLDLSKLEVNRMEVTLESVDIKRLTARIVANFESAAAQKNIDLQCEVDAKISPALMLDGQKVEKILNNLISNALKFTPKEGSVQVVVREQAQQMVLSVSDTGRGIPEKDLSKVFDRFYQSKREDAELLGGLGIGLALSKELAGLMQGSLWVESKNREGATFFLQLPLIPTQKANSQQPDQVEEDMEEELPVVALPTETHAKILLVEDNELLRNFLSLVLSDTYEVLPARHGQEALDHLSETKVDLIISDVMMPVMDGFELLEKIKSNPTFQQIPIIMLTARAELKDKLQALRIGVDDYLIKPFDEEELKVRIANLLTNYRGRNQTEEGEEEIEETHPLGEADRKWLAQVEALVLKQIETSNLNLTMLIDELAISHRQFNRRLKTLTGLNASGYIKEVRLHYAKELLLRGTYKTIAEVSYAVGFNTPKYFSRLFYQRFGKNPSDMAKS